MHRPGEVAPRRGSPSIGAKLSSLLRVLPLTLATYSNGATRLLHGRQGPSTAASASVVSAEAVRTLPPDELRAPLRNRHRRSLPCGSGRLTRAPPQVHRLSIRAAKKGMGGRSSPEARGIRRKLRDSTS